MGNAQTANASTPSSPGMSKGNDTSSPPSKPSGFDAPPSFGSPPGSQPPPAGFAPPPGFQPPSAAPKTDVGSVSVDSGKLENPGTMEDLHKKCKGELC